MAGKRSRNAFDWAIAAAALAHGQSSGTSRGDAGHLGASRDPYLHYHLCHAEPCLCRPVGVARVCLHPWTVCQTSCAWEAWQLAGLESWQLRSLAHGGFQSTAREKKPCTVFGRVYGVSTGQVRDLPAFDNKGQSRGREARAGNKGTREPRKSQHSLTKTAKSSVNCYAAS